MIKKSMLPILIYISKSISKLSKTELLKLVIIFKTKLKK
jgi:hypothetical protein